MNEESVESSLREWQRALGLHEWGIRVQVVREAWRKSGDIEIDACNKLAVLMINGTVAPELLDEVVLHELVHLKLHGLDRMTEDLLNCLYGEDEEDPRRKFAHAQFMDTLETTAQDLTRAMLGLARAPEGATSPPARRVAKREIEPE